MLAHDWCHVRRKYFDAEGTSPKEAAAFLDDIGKLFSIEREIVERSMGLDEKARLELTHAIRQDRSKPIVNAIGARAAEMRAVPDTPIAKAITYLDNHWRGLIVFLADPRVPITSNAAERALRAPVLFVSLYTSSSSAWNPESAIVAGISRRTPAPSTPVAQRDLYFGSLEVAGKNLPRRIRHNLASGQNSVFN